jgi:hypothetical protein
MQNFLDFSNIDSQENEWELEILDKKRWLSEVLDGAPALAPWHYATLVYKDNQEQYSIDSEILRRNYNQNKNLTTEQLLQLKLKERKPKRSNIKLPHKCTRCGKEGHNKRSCKYSLE